MSPVAPVNPSPSPQAKSNPAFTYIGSGQMSEYNDTRRCSLCGVTIHNFRIIKPILRWDESRPYFHRVGHHRGLSPSQPIGWSCGKHHVIDPDWLPQEMRNAATKRGLDRIVTTDNNCAMTAREEIADIRSKLGLGREKFGHRIHKSASTVYKWERGEVPVDETSLDLARRLLMEKQENKNYAA
jgi:DNA-binding transcriptional regulator YiaG